VSRERARVRPHRRAFRAGIGRRRAPARATDAAQLTRSAPPPFPFFDDRSNAENNGISGALAPELSALPSMRFLILEQGGISGTIPPEYGELERLLIIDVDFNDISGTLPETLYDLSALQQLDLNDNRISGTISTRIGQLGELTFLQFDHNLLSSDIPSEMGLLENLSEYEKHSAPDLAVEKPDE
jgi:hypothetical protein